jgi:hypothetical protein
MPHYVEIRNQVGCPNPTCLATRPWNPEDTLRCPLCDAVGVYVGIAAKEQDLTPEEEAARTVRPITEHEHAPPEAEE